MKPQLPSIHQEHLQCRAAAERRHIFYNDVIRSVSYLTILKHLSVLRSQRQKKLSVLRIAVHCELSPITVRRGISYLRARGFVTTSRPVSGIPYDIELCPEAIELLADEERTFARIS